MFCYYNYGYKIKSDINLPLNIKVSPAHEKIIQVQELININAKSRLVPYTVDITQDKKLQCFVEEYDSSLILDFEHYVLFEFIKYEDRILFSYYFYDEYPTEWKERLICRFGFSYLLSWLGMTVLHGSAVSDGENTICMVADSNSGKSSLAGLFVSDGKYLVADELVVLESRNNNLIVYNSSSYLFLSENSICKLRFENCSIEHVGFSFKNDYMDLSEDKKRVNLSNYIDINPRICNNITCIIRDEGIDPWIETLKITDAFVLLLRYIYAPIVFPFMRKNLLDIVKCISVQKLHYYDCFDQFGLIKSILKFD